MANRRFIQFFKTLHNEPVLLDCNFVVDAANGNGLGIRSLKGPGVAGVYMHTSAPLVGSGNPNPAAGEIIVKLQDNYNRIFSGFNSINGPLGAATTSSKANVINVITVLGTATLAQWQAVGLPLGITPAVGVAFVGSVAAVIGGSAQTAIMLAAGSGITNIESAGDGNLSLSPQGPANAVSGAGGVFYLRCMKNAVLTAPTDGTTISLAFYLSNTRILAAGE